MKDCKARSIKRVVVCHAHNSDLTKGFTQLAVQMIALNQWQPKETNLLGAITAGDIWQFGVLHSASRLIWQDINLLRVPADLPNLLQVLAAALLP